MSRLPGFPHDPVFDRMPLSVKVYVVGGAVRDLLLGRSATDKDWVVVGASASEMESAGFTPVGVDFPVFLHPVTKQEYALARTERKSGHGYKGFTFYADKQVTLEQDLLRRDFTINAMAMSANGELIDPYGGQADLGVKLFRHVSPAFAEDPLRILRLARFLARFDEFEVADETLLLCRDLVDQGEVRHLVSERVFAELDRAMSEKTPARAWSLLAGLRVWAELLTQVPGFWREISPSSIKVLNDPMSRQAKWYWWLAVQADRELILQLCRDLKIPNDLRDGALVWSALDGFFDLDLTGTTVDRWAELLSQVDIYRKPERLDRILKEYRLVNPETMGLQILEQLLSEVLSGQFKIQQKQYLDAHSGCQPAQAVADFRGLWIKKALG